MDINKDVLNKITHKIEAREKAEQELMEKTVAKKVKYNPEKWGTNEKKYLVTSDINKT